MICWRRRHCAFSRSRTCRSESSRAHVGLPLAHLEEPPTLERPERQEEQLVGLGVLPSGSRRYTGTPAGVDERTGIVDTCPAGYQPLSCTRDEETGKTKVEMAAGACAGCLPSKDRLCLTLGFARRNSGGSLRRMSVPETMPDRQYRRGALRPGVHRQAALSPTPPGRWGERFGSRSRPRPTGAGSATAKTARGIRP